MTEYALHYTCGHYYCGCHGEPMPPPFGFYHSMRAPWRIKDIDAPCPACSPKVRRLDPETVQRIAEEEWS